MSMDPDECKNVHCYEDGTLAGEFISINNYVEKIENMEGKFIKYKKDKFHDYCYLYIDTCVELYNEISLLGLGFCYDERSSRDAYYSSDFQIDIKFNDSDIINNNLKCIEFITEKEYNIAFDNMIKQAISYKNKTITDLKKIQ